MLREAIKEFIRNSVSVEAQTVLRSALWPAFAVVILDASTFKKRRYKLLYYVREF